MNNPLEWLSQYDETDLRKAFRDEEYSSFSDYYSDYADSYDFDVWYEYLLSLSPLKIDERSKVLDLGCGTGDMMLRFIDDGVFTVGVDYSEEMITAAEDNIFLYDEDIYRYILIKEDISRFYLSAKFDFIYSMGDTVNYLSYYKLSSLFFNMRYMLKKGAVFTFDAINPEHFIINKAVTEIVDIDDDTKISFLREKKEYPDGIYLDTIVNILDNDGNILAKESHHQRIFSIDEISFLADKCGFEATQVPFIDENDDAEKIQVILKVK